VFGNVGIPADVNPHRVGTGQRRPPSPDSPSPACRGRRVEPRPDLNITLSFRVRNQAMPTLVRRPGWVCTDVMGAQRRHITMTGAGGSRAVSGPGATPGGTAPSHRHAAVAEPSGLYLCAECQHADAPLTYRHTPGAARENQTSQRPRLSQRIPQRSDSSDGRVIGSRRRSAAPIEALSGWRHPKIRSLYPRQI
jgi:hypothetical protein